jgi:putative ABC transport system permease protein
VTRRAAAALSRVRLLNLRYLLAHRARTFASIAVVALAAELIVAVFGTYGSLSGSVGQFSRSIAGSATMVVTGISDTGFGEDLLPAIGAAPGVKAAVPVVQATVLVDQHEASLFGVDQRLGALSSELNSAVTSIPPGLRGRADGVAVGSGLAAAAHLSVGGELAMTSLTGAFARLPVLYVAGGPEAARVNGGFFVVAPLPLAQAVLQRPGELDAIYVVPKPGVAAGALRSELSGLVAGRAFVGAPDFQVAQASTAESLAEDGTLLIALMALVVAAFLVFNTTNMAAAERRSEIATLRALGARRWPILRDFLAEFALVGLVGASIGSPIGVLVARFAIDRLPPSLTASFSLRIGFVLPWYAIPLAVGACLAAVLAATWLAAWRAVRVQPVEAMRPAGLALDGEERRRYPLAAGIVGAGALVVAGGTVVAVNDERSFAAQSAFIVGVILLGYALTGPIAAGASRVARLLGAAGRLAAASIDRTPRRVWTVTMTVTIAIALGFATTGALDNTVSATDRTVSSLARTDLFVQSTPADVLPTAPVMPASLAAQIAAVPGVRRVVPGQFTYATLSGGGALDGARILVQGVSGESNTVAYAQASPAARAELLAGTGAVVSRRLARALHVGEGGAIDLPTPSGTQRLRVAGLVDYPTIDSGLVAISAARLEAWFHRVGATFFEVDLVQPDQVSEARAAIGRVVATLHHPVYVVTGAEELQATSGAIQQASSLALTIQWIVAVVAGLALLNTFMLAVVERQRELGILRALGARASFVSRVVAAEAIAATLVGAVAGLVVGVALQYIATVVLANTAVIAVPFQPVAIAFGAALVALVLSLVGALPPARRAAHLDVIAAIGYE